MAKFIIKNPIVTVNGVDLSDHCDQATVHTEFEDVDLTAFGSTLREHGRGLGDGSITLSFFQDFAGGEVDATLWPLSQSDTPFPVHVRPTNGAISATNPEFQMTGLLFNYDPIAGSVGEASKTEVEFQNASQTGITRDVTP